MSGYWICHQCGQRVPASQVELHNIRHLTRGNTQSNRGASPAEIAALFTLVFSLVAWIVKILYKLVSLILQFCKRRPRLALEIGIVAAFSTALLLSNPSIFNSLSTPAQHQEKITNSKPKQNKSTKVPNGRKLQNKDIRKSGSVDVVSEEKVIAPKSAAPSSTTPAEYFQWPPTVSSQVTTQDRTTLTGVNWKPIPNLLHWYTYTEPQWEWCGGGSSQCERIWWVSDKYCSGASPLAQYTLDGITHSSPGWHGSATPFVAVLGIYELPGNSGGDRSLQSRLAIYEAVSVGCRSL